MSNDEQTTTTNPPAPPPAAEHLFEAVARSALPRLTPTERRTLRGVAYPVLAGAIEINQAAQRFARMAQRSPGLWTALAVGASSSLAGIAAGLCLLSAAAALTVAGAGDEDRPDEPFAPPTPPDEAPLEEPSPDAAARAAAATNPT